MLKPTDKYTYVHMSFDVAGEHELSASVTGEGELLVNGEPCSDEKFLETVRRLAVVWKDAMLAKEKEMVRDEKPAS